MKSNQSHSISIKNSYEFAPGLTFERRFGIESSVILQLASLDLSKNSENTSYST